MSQHRLEQYFTDCESFVAQHAIKKMISDVIRLKHFLFKHQNESCAENVQTKLYMTIDRYYHFSVNPLYAEKEGVCQLRDVVTNLISDFLSLPEGKLATAKHKKKCLAFLDSLTAGNTSITRTREAVSDEESHSVWIVADIDDDMKTLTLMKADINSDACLEGVPCISDDLFAEVRRAFDVGETGEPLSVIASAGQVVRMVESP